MTYYDDWKVRNPDLTTLDRLDLIARLHAPGADGLCAVCRVEHPCPTYVYTGAPREVR
jgi:hypothetical protein